MNAIPPLLRAPVLAVLFWWVALALGVRVCKWLRYPEPSLPTEERAFIAVSLGLGFLQYIPYALAAAGLLSHTAIRIAWLALMLLLGRDLLEVARWLGGVRAWFARRTLTSQDFVWAALFTLVMGLLFMHALSLGPLGEDDGYHLAAPKRWLESGTLHYLPTYTTTNLPLGFEMLYAIGLSAGNPIGVKLIHYGTGLLTFFGLWLSARRLGNGLAGITAISLLLIANPVVNLPFLFRLAYVDFGSVLMVIATVLLWLIWREQREQRALVCLALLAGFATTMKLTAASALVAWAPILVWEARRNGMAWGKLFTSSVKLGLLAFAPVVPWLLRNWRNTGNPIYPMLFTLIPSRDWDARVAGDLGRHARLFSWGLVAGSRLSEGQRKLIVLAVAGGVLLLGGLAVMRLRHPALRALSFFATVMVVAAVAIGGLVFRYWLPGIMCATLVATSWAIERWPARRLHLWLASGMMTVALVVVLRSYGRDLGNDVRLATGVSSMDEIHGNNEAWEMWGFINAKTPQDSRVLLAAFYPMYGAGNFGNFWTDRTCFITDAHAQAHVHLGDWQTFLQGVRADRVTHVVISAQSFPPDRYGYRFPEAVNEYPFSRRLVDQMGERLVRFGNLELYRLLPEKLEQ